MGYFIRRSGDDCAVIRLHPHDREEVIADGLAPAEAEDLCASKIEEMPGTPAPSVGGEPGPRPPRMKKHGERQLAFKF